MTQLMALGEIITPYSFTIFYSWLGKKETEEYRRQLEAAKRHAESVAIITPELEQAFCEVCFLLVNMGKI